MLSCKAIFEDAFGGELIWQRNYTKAAGDTCARIYVEMSGDIYQKELWPEMIHFLIDAMLRLERAFLLVQDYLIHF